MQRTQTLKNIEKTFGENELIVSRTDTRGIIEYCNKTFINISGYPESELLGKPHSMIRHPDMPKAVFKLLWEYISSGKEIFAYVKNLCKGGEYYWVIAHVTATYDDAGKIIGYHSNRRSPKADAVKKASALYSELLQLERSASSTTEGVNKAYETLIKITTAEGVDYNEFILKI
jgi:PAS domain S-box-containing protein